MIRIEFLGISSWTWILTSLLMILIFVIYENNNNKIKLQYLLPFIYHTPPCIHISYPPVNGQHHYHIPSILLSIFQLSSISSFAHDHHHHRYAIILLTFPLSTNSNNRFWKIIHFYTKTIAIFLSRLFQLLDIYSK